MAHPVFDAVFLPARLLGASFKLVCSPRLLRWCLPPWILGLVTSWAAFGFVSSRIDTFVIQETGLTQGVLQQLGRFLGVGGAVVISALVGLLCVIIAGGFFFDFLVEEALVRSGATIPSSASLRARVGRTLRALGTDVAVLCLVLFVSLLGMVLSFFPPLALLSAIIGIAVLGYELADKPLSILEVPFRDRLALVRRHSLECGAMGSMQALVILIPGANILLLPVFYLLSADVVARWRRDFPIDQQT